MQAIVTKYIGPSATKESRIKATAAAGSRTVPYDHALNRDENHRAAAVHLTVKLGWNDYGNLVQGGLPDSTGDVFVFEPRSTAALRDALGNLCQHVAGNRGNRDGNPYGKAEMRAALLALYVDQHDGNHPLVDSDAWDSADKYRTPTEGK